MRTEPSHNKDGNNSIFVTGRKEEVKDRKEVEGRKEEVMKESGERQRVCFTTD